MTTFYDNKITNLNEITRIIRNLNKERKQVVFACVGTPICTYDSVGPIIGSILKAHKIKNVYGTQEDPLSCSTVPIIVPQIRAKHKNDFIIGIDACLASKNGSDLLNLLISDTPVNPRRGVDDSLAKYSIGNISIKLITGITSNNSNDIIMSIGDKLVILNSAYAISKSIINAMK